MRAAFCHVSLQVKVTSDCTYNIVAGEGEKLGCTGDVAGAADSDDDHDHDHDHDHGSSSTSTAAVTATATGALMVLVSSLALAFRAADLP